ncbi:MAG: hypothetical protein J6N49_03565 [Alphaproteobacteria bacterium]|nr:hypothetical protein [Alphaproteobacteria bacterium]
MATESILVKTKDNYVMVFSIDYANDAEKARLMHECERLCSNITYARGFNITTGRGITYDQNNSEFINKEVLGYHYEKKPDEYRNDLTEVNYSSEVMQPNTIHFGNTVSDSDVPAVIKNLGYKLEAKDNLCQVERVGDNYFVRNRQKTLATVYQGEKRIEFLRNHYQFPPAEYTELQTMVRSFEVAKSSNPALDIFEYARDNIHDRRRYNLFRVYADEYDHLQHLDNTVGHELKHIKNGVFYHGLSLKNDVKRLSVEDCYRISVEDERSAYLQQIINSMNKYLKGGNFNDYSMFDAEGDSFMNKLKAKSSDAERLAYATNLPLLVKEMFEQFDRTHKRDYDLTQFPQTTDEVVKNQPATAPLDADRAWFKKLRSLYYNFEVYDPRTGRTEPKNLAQYITPDLEVEITDEVNRGIITPQKAAMTTKINNTATQVANGSINPDLIAPAKALMRDAIHQSTFITQVDNFRIATLYEDENTNRPQPTSTPTPTPTNPEPEPVPTDRADWSDNLQAYWKNVEGYQEVAKNNIEYKFKINDATVRYTSPRKVEVSSNADYNLYTKLLQEPTNKNKPVEFLDTLTKEQALTLYIACINNGRRPVGAVPRDLSGIENIQGIPESELQKFRQLESGGPSGSSQQRGHRSASSSRANAQKTNINQIMVIKRSLSR